MLDLSTDVIVKIFYYLTSLDVEELLGKLDQIDVHHPHPQVKTLRLYAYGRLYQGKIVIYSNKYKGVHSTHDAVMKINDFSQKFNVGTVPSDHPSSALEDEILRSSRPHHIAFNFIREPTDYVTFVKDLTTFSHILDSKDKVLRNYLQSVCQTDVCINGKAIVVEPTTSFLTSVLKVLISLSNTDPSSHIFCEKLTELTIQSTDIGQYFSKQWGTLFSRFKNVKILNLSDNLIGSGNFSEDGSDIIGSHFQWPPGLIELDLSNNFIDRISSQFIDNLPPTLQILSLNNNSIRSVGIDDEDMFHIFSLPSLRILELCDNNRLVIFNPEVLNNCDANFEQLRILRCNITNLSDLKVAASQNKFTLAC
ncbi:hypothetical protein CLIB1444_08S00716 [[Candida] jaroonii]|uniref:Uncharacterized protein n=1 Tax=[Candida] jaroonii TaxID=467808 RepID=A0ACA9YAG0_9ASCO|nr:hypothetical protein CLIB1444_08S00716 [[Candida] jaroonii]